MLLEGLVEERGAGPCAVCSMLGLGADDLPLVS